MYLVKDNYISAESHPCSPRTRKNILFLFFFVNEYSRLEHTCKLDYFKINFTNLSQTIEDRKHFFLNNRLFSVMYKFTTISALLKVRQVLTKTMYCHEYLILIVFFFSLKLLKNSFSISYLLVASNDVSKISTANFFSMDFGRLDSGIYKTILVISNNNYCNI